MCVCVCVCVCVKAFQSMCVVDNAQPSASEGQLDCFCAPSMHRCQFCCLKGLFRQKRRARVDSTPWSTQISPKWREHQKSPKVVDFVQPAAFTEAISKVRLLGPPKWREPHKSPKVVDFVNHFQGPFGLLDFRLVGPLKWREHKSPKVVNFVESAPFAEAISKAPWDLLDFRLLGPLKWRKPHKSPQVVDFVPRPLRICWMSGFWDRRNGGNFPTKAEKLSIL